MIIKTLLIWLAIMLQCLPATAGGVLMLGGGGVAAVAGLCASGTPGDPSDVWCEDFKSSTLCATGEASVCWNTWTVSDQYHGTVVFASDTGITITATTANDAYVETVRSISGNTSIYMKFKLNIASESLADTNTVNLLAISSTSGDNNLKLRQTSGSLYLDLAYNANTVTGSTAISTGTDITVEIYTNEVGETMQLWIGGTSQGTATSNYEAYDDLKIGVYNPAAVLSYSIRDIQIDNDTRP